MGWENKAKRNSERTEMLRKKEEELDRKAQATLEQNYARAVELVRGNVAVGRTEFIRKLKAINSSYGVFDQQDLKDPQGPWVGADIGDQQGTLATIQLQAVVSAASILWAWTVQCGGKGNPPKTDSVQSSSTGPDKDYVVEEFGKRFNFCYRAVRR